jgi:hypothetical protein
VRHNPRVDDMGFWWECAARLGPPIVAGTVVAALLRSEFGWPHGALLALGLALMVGAHWNEQHKGK